MLNSAVFTLTIPTHRRQFTFRAFGYGALLLGWLSLETTSVLVVTLLGTGLALLLVALALVRWFGGRTLPLSRWLPGGLLIGGITGFSAVGCIVLLMVFKSAWHSHAFPDFPAEVVADMMARTPIWTIAGCLLGQSLALLRFMLHPGWASA